MKLRFCLLVSVSWLAANPVLGGRVYFTDQPATTAGLLLSVSLNGSQQQTILTLSNSPDIRGVAFHRASGRVYFLDNGAAKRIYSILPNGTDQQEVTAVTSNLIGSDLEIDEGAGKIYWSEAN